MTMRHCELVLRRLLGRLDAHGEGYSLVACHVATALDAARHATRAGREPSDADAPAGVPDLFAASHLPVRYGKRDDS